MSKKYVMERIDDVRREVSEKIRRKYMDNVKSLTTREKYNLIKKGKVKLRSLAVLEKDYYGSPNWYDFKPYDKRENAQVHCRKIEKKLEAEVQKAKDEVMIGDMKEALTILEKLRKFEV